MTAAWRIVRKDHENCGEVFAQAGRQPDHRSVRLLRPDLDVDWRRNGWDGDACGDIPTIVVPLG